MGSALNCSQNIKGLADVPLPHLDMKTHVCPSVEGPKKKGGITCFCCGGPFRAADRSKVQEWPDSGVSLPPLGSLNCCVICF